MIFKLFCFTILIIVLISLSKDSGMHIYVYSIPSIVRSSTYKSLFINGPYSPLDDNNYSKTIVTVNNFTLTTDLAITEDQKTKGLSIKNHLQENQGMLFIYNYPAPHPFWMKDMKFPIDIIWLDRNGTVTHIETKLQPCIPKNICHTYTPKSSNSLYVLETVAGFSQKHNVKVGTSVFLPFLSKVK